MKLWDRARPPWQALALLGWLVGVTVQTGSLMSADAAVRYSVARSLWTSAPPLDAANVAVGVVGRDGTLQVPFGLGQSLLMLPGDIVAGTLTRALGVRKAMEERVAIAVTSFTVFPLLTTGIALAGYWLLLATGAFARRESFAGALGLLLATGVLPYSQIHQENNLVLFLTTLAFAGTTTWVVAQASSGLVVASCAVGGLLLTRLPALVATAPVLLAYAAGVLRAQRRGRQQSPPATPRALDSSGGQNDRRSWRHDLHRVFGWNAMRIVLPVIGTALLAERGYHVYRFGLGAFAATYWDIKSAQVRGQDPETPVGWPFSGDPVEGFLGPLIDPQRSVFITEPLLLLLAIVVATRWKTLDAVARQLLLGLGLVLGLYLALHARLVFWSGAWGWGARYHTAPVQLLAMLSIPLAMSQSGRVLALFRRTMIPVAVAWQICAVAIDYSVEEVQAFCRGAPVALLPTRLDNLARVIRGDDLPAFGGCSLAYHDDWRKLTFLPFRNGQALPENVRTPLAWAWGALAGVTSLLALALARHVSLNASPATRPPRRLH